MVKDLTHGKIAPLIIRFCLPLVAGNLFQQLYNVVDTVIVGKFIGKNALSAMGAIGSLHFLVIGSIVGLCAGFAIPVAQAFGAQDDKKIRRLMAHIFYLVTGFAAVISALTVVFTDDILHLMNTPDDIYKDAHDYIIIIFGGILATVLYNTLASVVQAVGDSKTPLYFLLLASFLNIVLDLLFIIVFKMGVKGAALATIFSQIVSGILLLLVVKKRFKTLHFSKKDMSFDKNLCKTLLSNGLPLAMQFSITAIGTVMLQTCVNTLGSDVIAAMTVSSKVLSIMMLPCESIGMAMATYCGQNLGAGKIDRIKKGVTFAAAIGLAYSAAAMMASLFAGHHMAVLFVDRAELEVLNYVKEYFKICVPFYPTLMLIYIYRNSLQGLGYSVLAMGAGVLELIARGIVGFGFVMTLGFVAACYASPVAWVAADLFLVPMYFYKIRKLSRSYKLNPA